MKDPAYQNRTGAAIAVLLAAVPVALVLDFLFGLQVGVFVFLILPIVSAYVYAGWKRAWFVGLLSALLLAFLAGGTVPPRDDTALGFLVAGLWSFIPASLAALMVFVGASEVLVIWRYDDRSRAWEIMAGLLSMTLGRARAVLPSLRAGSFSVQVVSKGQIVYAKPPIGSRPIPGPGVIVVESGNALLLEKNGNFTRIVGPGVAVTAPYEAISAVVDLSLQTTRFASELQVLTKDGIPLALSCTVQYRVHGDEQALIDDAKYTLDEKAIRRALLCATDWKADTELAARNALRTIIAECYLDQVLYSPRTTNADQSQDDHRVSALESGNPEPNRIYLSRRVQQELSDQTSIWGVEITKVTLDEISIPEEVRKRILEHWNVEWVYDVDARRTAAELRISLQRARWEGKVGKIKAAGEVDMDIVMAEGRKRIAEIDSGSRSGKSARRSRDNHHKGKGTGRSPR